MSYTVKDFRTLMKTGKAAGDREARRMGKVARTRFSHLTAAEVDDLHAYLGARADEKMRAADAR